MEPASATAPSPLPYVLFPRAFDDAELQRLRGLLQSRHEAGIQSFTALPPFANVVGALPDDDDADYAWLYGKMLELAAAADREGQWGVLARAAARAGPSTVGRGGAHSGEGLLLPTDELVFDRFGPTFTDETFTWHCDASPGDGRAISIVAYLTEPSEYEGGVLEMKTGCGDDGSVGGGSRSHCGGGGGGGGGNSGNSGDGGDGDGGSVGCGSVGGGAASGSGCCEEDAASDGGGNCAGRGKDGGGQSGGDKCGLGDDRGSSSAGGKCGTCCSGDSCAGESRDVGGAETKLDSSGRAGGVGEGKRSGAAGKDLSTHTDPPEQSWESLVCQPGSAVAFRSDSLEHRVTNVTSGERRSLLLLCGTPKDPTKMNIRRLVADGAMWTTEEDRVWW
jgi:hypothetical protein